MIYKLAQIDVSTSAVIALLLFSSTFILILIRTFLTQKKEIQRQANIPLDDGERSLPDEKK